MKKFYVLLAIVLFSGYIFAQSTRSEFKVSNVHKQSELKVNAKTLAPTNLPVLKSTKGTQTQWFSYINRVQDSLHPTAFFTNYTTEMLFPDTLVKIQYSDGYFGMNTHGIANTLHLRAPIFQTQYLKNKAYTLDSIHVPCFYRKNIDDATPDTLIVDVVTGYLGPLSGFAYTPGTSPYSEDTVLFPRLFFKANTSFDHNFDKARLDAAATAAELTPLPKMYTIKYLLTAKDSVTGADGANHIYISTKSIPAASFNSSVIATAIQFKPGYFYQEGDHIANLNYFRFFSFQLNGKWSYPTYTKSDFNCSYLMLTKYLYETSTGWDGEYLPEWTWTNDQTQGFNQALQTHWIDYLITQTTSITENKAGTVKLDQNMPNPAGNSTLIAYELTKATDVRLSIIDITGKNVMEVKEGKQMAGAHSITINTNNLSNGMYYYTLNADNTSITKKMIVNK